MRIASTFVLKGNDSNLRSKKSNRFRELVSFGPIVFFFLIGTTSLYRSTRRNNVHLSQLKV